jgi:alkylation response protein AidB-like acyl-CoA dehydrogenase
MSATGTATVGELPPLFEDEHNAYRESYRTFLERRVLPSSADWRREGRIPRELFRACADHGFLGMPVPEQYGGPGVQDPRFGIVLAQEAMRASVPELALALLGHTDAAVAAIVRRGSEAQRARWLPGLASGDTLAAIAYGDLLLAGNRVLGTCTSAVQGAQADLFLLVASIGDDSNERRLLLVDREAEGVAVEPCDPTIGLDAAAFAAISFDRAPCSVLGDAHRGPGEATTDFQLGLAASALAGAQKAFATTLTYVANRKAFGQAIASFQHTRHVLARDSASLAAAEAFLDRCIRLLLAGTLTASRAAALKLYCTELYGAVTDHGVQLHGGYGYILEYEIARAYGDARFWRLHGGSSEAMQDVVAHELLD